MRFSYTRNSYWSLAGIRFVPRKIWIMAFRVFFPSGQIRVVDLDEIADAMEQGLLDQTQLCLCMRRLDALLREIYSQKLLPSLESYWLL